MPLDLLNQNSAIAGNNSEENCQNQCNNMLPDEMLLKVFEYLDPVSLIACAKVCRSWNRVSGDEKLWRNTDLGARLVHAAALPKLVTRGITNLRLTNAKICNHAFEHTFPESDDAFAINLQYIDLSMASIMPDTLETVLARCRNLKRLSLERAVINVDICHQISKNRNLNILNLAFCRGLEAVGMHMLMTSLTNLTSLNVSWANLSKETFAALVSNITPNIIRLNVAGCRWTSLDVHMPQLSERCPFLMELDVSNCTLYHYNVVRYICKLKCLKYLAVSHWHLLAAVYEFVRKLPMLTCVEAMETVVFPDMDLYWEFVYSRSTYEMNQLKYCAFSKSPLGERPVTIWGFRTIDPTISFN